MAFSYKDYTGDGVTDTFTITFDYTDTSEISVTVNGVAETGLTFPSTTSVQLTSAPASDALVRVRRTTDLDARSVDFASGSVLTEEDLDNSNIQVFHAAQEAVDTANDAVGLDSDDKMDAQSKIIKNVADPVNNQDAVTKNYLENTWLTTADKAQLNSLDTDNLDIVAGNTSNINAVAADATDIGTVSTNIASVNTVATNIADVITVANDLNEAISEIETAADDLNEAVSEIDTVATSISSVNTVGTNIADVNTVAGNIANVNTVAGNTTNINTISGISGNVTTVAGISADVTTVAADGTDIGTVATNIANVNSVAGNATNINNVAGNATNINTVAGISADVTTVAGDSADIQAVAADATDIGTVSTNIANVNTVAGISANVTAVAGDATDIGTVAADLAGSDTIGTVATNISNVNAVGGDIANVNTVATNISSVNDFADKYRIGASDPTTSLDEGDLFYNTTTDTLKVYTGSAWEQGVTAGSGFLPTTGGSMTGDINFGDNDKAIFGAGSDLQIYHSGSNSIVRDTGAGDLYLAGDANVYITNSALGEFKAAFTTDGAASLYYDNSAKLATTSTGIDVTGTVTADGLGVGITTPAYDAHIHESDSGNSLLHFTNATTGTTGSDGFTVGLDASEQAILLHRENTSMVQYTNGTQRLRLENNGDISFYDSTGVTQGLFYQASTQRLGLGTTSISTNFRQEIIGLTGSNTSSASSGTTQNPSALLRLRAGGGFTATLDIGQGGGAGSWIQSTDTSNLATTYPLLLNPTGGNVGIGTASPDQTLVVKTADGGGIAIENAAGNQYRWAVNNDDSFAVIDSGTAERLRIDSSGNLLVGRTSVGDTGNGHSIRGGDSAIFSRNAVGETMQIGRNANDGDLIRFKSNGATVGSIGVKDSTNTYIGSGAAGFAFAGSGPAITPYNTTANNYTDNTVDLGNSFNRFKDLYLSGDTFVGEASTIGAGETGVTVRGLGQIRVGRAGTSAATLVSFNNGNGEVGTIVTSGTSTAYNTSSDYRLKENVTADWDATTRLKQLNPVRFNFIADADTTVDGFIAHEVQDVVPEAISGTKDAMRDEECEVTPAVLDEDGNVVTPAVMGTRSVPDYQGIDQSKLVPLLVKTIQELEARIAALEAN